MLSIRKNLADHAKSSINIDNANHIYDLYMSILKKLCIDFEYLYTPSDTTEINIITERDSILDSEYDRSVMNELRKDTGNVYFQPILAYRKRLDKICLFDGIHRYLIMKDKPDRECLIVILNNTLDRRYYNITLPKEISLYSDYILEYVIQPNDIYNIVPLRDMSISGIPFTEIKVKGVIPMMVLLTYWSKYVDVVYDLYKEGKIKLEPHPMINNKTIIT